MALTNTETKNYVIARGDLYFAERVGGVLGGERMVGNTPSISLTISTTTTNHYSSARGVRTQDRSVPTQVDRSGKFTTDDVNPKNMSLLLLGDAQAVTRTLTEDQTETFDDVEQGLTYQVGISPTNPAGLQQISITAVKVGNTAKTEGTDYIKDEELGRVTIVEGGSIATGADVIVEYDILASTTERVVSGSTVKEGALRVIEYNPEGKNKTWYFPSVKLSPDGDIAIKSENDWQMQPFSLNIQEPTDGSPAIIVDGRAFTA